MAFTLTYATPRIKNVKFLIPEITVVPRGGQKTVRFIKLIQLQNIVNEFSIDINYVLKAQYSMVELRHCQNDYRNITCNDQPRGDQFQSEVDFFYHHLNF